MTGLKALACCAAIAAFGYGSAAMAKPFSASIRAEMQQKSTQQCQKDGKVRELSPKLRTQFCTCLGKEISNRMTTEVIADAMSKERGIHDPAIKDRLHKIGLKAGSVCAARIAG
jgi:hypothetical protein